MPGSRQESCPECVGRFCPRPVTRRELSGDLCERIRSDLPMRDFGAVHGCYFLNVVATFGTDVDRVSDALIVIKS